MLLRLKRWRWSALLLLVPLVGCRPIDVPDPEGQRRDGETLMNSKAIDQNAGTAKAAAKSVNPFGLDLLATTDAASQQKNVFLSPTSSWMALVMSYSGAGGSSKAELGHVLRIGADPAKSIVKLRAVLKAQGAKINLANAIWADKKTPFAPTFVAQSAKTFGAKAASLDFAAPDSIATINDWVSQQTEGKIPDLLKDLPPSGVVLTNALYFQGRWQRPFEKNKTRTADFQLPDGSKKSVEMMWHEEQDGFKGANFEATALPYANSSCELLALLPNKGETPLSVVEKLDDGQMANRKSSFTAEIKLPRFSLDWSDSLNEPLKKMGLTTVYKNSNFSVMGLPPNSSLADVWHQARLEIDEEGTTAAAATDIPIRAADEDEEPKVLVFDRPFVVLLRETKSGALLFAGIVNDPQPLK